MKSTLNISVFYPFALRMAKTPWSFGRSECNRLKASSVKQNCERELHFSNHWNPQNGNIQHKTRH